jgi:hypothetical protein
MVNPMLGSGVLSSIMGIMAAFIVVAFIFMVAVYVYSALALSTLAKRTNTQNPWLAWIPVGNLVLMANIAKMPWWPVLFLIGFIIPIVNFLAMIAFMVFVIIWMWKICEIRKRPGWWAVLSIIPFVGGIWGLILMGILAWAKE